MKASETIRKSVTHVKRILLGAGELVEPAGAGEDDEADLRITEDGELLGLLEQPVPPLGEGDLPARRVVYPPDHDLSPPHLDLSLSDLIIKNKDQQQQARGRRWRSYRTIDLAGARNGSWLKIRWFQQYLREERTSRREVAIRFLCTKNLMQVGKWRLSTSSPSLFSFSFRLTTSCLGT